MRQAMKNLAAAIKRSVGAVKKHSIGRAGAQHEEMLAASDALAHAFCEAGKDRNPHNYVKDAMRTLSPHYKPELVGLIEVLDALNVAVRAGNEAKFMKKAIFGGVRAPALGSIADSQRDLAEEQLERVPKHVLHAVLGFINEAGEMAECLLKSIRDGQPFDAINFMEEVGDNQWFGALACFGTGMDPYDVMDRNIAKLKVRFPDKFDSAQMDDGNRDLAAERAALTGNEPHPGVGFGITDGLHSWVRFADDVLRWVEDQKEATVYPSKEAVSQVVREKYPRFGRSCYAVPLSNATMAYHARNQGDETTARLLEAADSIKGSPQVDAKP